MNTLLATARSKVIPMIVLGIIVVASATQTELTSYLGKERNYSKPFFTFYLTHSIFVVLFPLHLLVLKISRPKVRIKVYLDGLRDVVADQLELGSKKSMNDLAWRFGRIILQLTALISIPSLCWYSAVPLTGVTDVTTIYATATFWTYGFSLLLLRTPLSRTIVLAVSIAFIGVMLITYAGVKEGQVEGHNRSEGRVSRMEEVETPTHRIVGDLLMLMGAVVLGLYEVIYKLSLPEGQGGVASETKSGDLDASGQYFTITPEEEDGDEDLAESPSSERTTQERPSLASTRSDFGLISLSRPALPGALHANFLTSCIGTATMAIFWIPLPLLHWTGLERWQSPGPLWGQLAIIALSGSAYNAGFMCLIGMLGPITASVANLLVIGLVAVIDAVMGETIPPWTLVGAGLVCAGFAVLLTSGEEGGHAVRVEAEPLAPIVSHIA